MRLILAAALAAACAPVALGQTQQSEFERYALAVATPCFKTQMTVEGAAGAITTCEKARTDFDTLKAAVPGLAGHDLNVYHIVSTMAFTRIARASAIVHGVNTPSVCAGMEGAWKHVSQVVTADSPGYATTVKGLYDAAAGEAAACRKLFPAPEGAPALPVQ